VLEALQICEQSESCLLVDCRGEASADTITNYLEYLLLLNGTENNIPSILRKVQIES
jgi:hypothetical protein